MKLFSNPYNHPQHVQSNLLNSNRNFFYHQRDALPEQNTYTSSQRTMPIYNDAQTNNNNIVPFLQATFQDQKLQNEVNDLYQILYAYPSSNLATPNLFDANAQKDIEYSERNNHVKNLQAQCFSTQRNLAVQHVSSTSSEKPQILTQEPTMSTMPVDKLKGVIKYFFI